jgi:MOSC domain-containing protein YiiM
MTGQGVVISMHVASTGAAPMRSITSARAVAGKGLEGDRYFNESGTYSNQPGSGREVTLIEIEAIEAMKRDYQIELDAGRARRNIVIQGIPLNHFVEKEFKVGAVILRGTRLCEPCAHMEKLTVKGAMRGLIHRGGLRAEIVKGGTIRVGDSILPESGT